MRRVVSKRVSLTFGEPWREDEALLKLLEALAKTAIKRIDQQME